VKILVLAAVFGGACGCGTSPAPEPPGRAPDSAAEAAHLDRIVHGLLPPVRVRGEDVRYALEDRMRKYHVHGVSIAVLDHGRLAWARGFGVADLDTRAPVTETTLFQAGSISKSVNALAQLQAVAQGTLGLDAPINDALRSWKLADNDLTRGAPITLRLLLSHTAGTNVHGFPGYVAGTPVPSLVQVLDGAPPANTPRIVVDQAPGKAYRYSGGGISITQLALVDQLRRPYPQLLAERVLGPLGMAHSTYEQPLPPARLAQAATGYDIDGKVVPGKRNVYPEMAAAGLWTTPSDLARFFLELQRARAGTSDKLPRALALQMTTAVAPADGGEVGLGVFLFTRNGARLFGHGGADTGFQADAVASLDRGYGIIIMANSDNSFPLFRELERAVFAEYGWDGADPPIDRVAIDATRLPSLTGRYGTAEQPVSLAAAAGKLELRRPFAEPVELVPVAADTFVALDDAARVHVDAGTLTFTRTDPARTESLRRLPEEATAPLLELEAGHVESAVAAARALRQTEPGAFDEGRTNSFGYRVRVRGNLAGSILIFRLNVALWPDSSNAYESLAEAYDAAGDRPQAIASYDLALSTLPRDTTTPPDLKQEVRRAATDALHRLHGSP
jgi:CubicO group peptidase (beta-lactamase class C family)